MAHGITICFLTIAFFFNTTTSFHHEPEHPRQVEEEGLHDEEDGHPLVVRVVDGRVLVGQAGAVAGERLRDVELAVHPAVALQHLVADAATGLCRKDRIDQLNDSPRPPIYLSPGRTGWGLQRSGCRTPGLKRSPATSQTFHAKGGEGKNLSSLSESPVLL